MATKYQHFVPSTYLDGWKLNGETLYYFKDKFVDVGEPRNPDSILKNAHTYTVGYNESIIMRQCPHIRFDFAKRVKEILNRRKVYAY